MPCLLRDPWFPRVSVRGGSRDVCPLPESSSFLPGVPRTVVQTDTEPGARETSGFLIIGIFLTFSCGKCAKILRLSLAVKTLIIQELLLYLT